MSEQTAVVEDDLVDLEPVPWHALMAVEGVVTGDRRAFAPESLRIDQLPIPLFFRHGGDISDVIGQVSSTWRDGNKIWASGTFNDTDAADQAITLIQRGDFRGVSIDADDWEGSLTDRELNPIDPSAREELSADDYVVNYITTARIRGLSLAPIAAFAEAGIALGASPDEASPEDEPGWDDADVEVTAEEEAEFRSLVASLTAAPGTHDGPGWITNPRATNRIRRYWTKGKGAAKIRWGVPGDFNRCRKLLAKYIVGTKVSLAGLCANMHKEAIGSWPGREKMSTEPCEDCAPVSIVASATRQHKLPPMKWFTDPELPSYIPITVRKDEKTGLMRVVGHVAQWGTCHIAWSDMACVTPPSSPSKYSFFHTGETETTDGVVLTGRVTAATDHADAELSFAAATAHYDNTGHAVADIVVGEDSHGIWMSGWVRPWATPQQIHELRASAVSGDWRTVGGALEMIGVLSVNVNGFQIPRTTLHNDKLVSLVAAGFIPQRKEVAEAGQQDIEAVIERAIERYEARKLELEVKQLAEAFEPDPQEYIAELAKAFD